MSGNAFRPAKMRRAMSRVSELVRGRHPNHPKVRFDEYLYRPDEPTGTFTSRDKILGYTGKSLETSYFMRRRIRMDAAAMRTRLYKGAR